MSNRITIIDYGIGNLYSVRRAVEVSGGKDICITDQVREIKDADKSILPGVGAFEDGIKGLSEKGLVEPIIEAVRSGKPVLGICLGMQLLASFSEEFGFHKGLGLIPGMVRAIPNQDVNGETLKVPFICWAPLLISNIESANHSCLANSAGKAVYLVHSYHVIPEDPAHLLATYEFGGRKITAAIKSENITGVQFHPEKSGEVGLSIMKSFIGE